MSTVLPRRPLSPAAIASAPTATAAASTPAAAAPTAPSAGAATTGGEEISSVDYAFLADLLFRESGLTLVGDKCYLLRTRLAAAAQTWGGGTLRGLVATLRTEQARGSALPRLATRAVCDAMTTNETLFFRDGHPFDVLRDVFLPEAARRIGRTGTPRPVRIWSAAASTGQEPYSLAICAALAAPQMGGVPVEIVATDYSATALARAREGTYTDFEVRRGLPPAIGTRFFTPAEGGRGMRANDALRRAVRFEQRNLLDSFVGLGLFDVIFCRNVLLYFDLPTKRGVLDRMADVLAPGGLLLLGGAETPLGVSTRLARAPGTATPAYSAVPR